MSFHSSQTDTASTARRRGHRCVLQVCLCSRAPRVLPATLPARPSPDARRVSRVLTVAGKETGCVGVSSPSSYHIPVNDRRHLTSCRQLLYRSAGPFPPVSVRPLLCDLIQEVYCTVIVVIAFLPRSGACCASKHVFPPRRRSQLCSRPLPTLFCPVRCRPQRPRCRPRCRLRCRPSTPDVVHRVMAVDHSTSAMSRYCPNTHQTS